MWCWKTVLVCLAIYVKTAELYQEAEEGTPDEEEPPRVFFFVFCGLAAGGILRALFKVFNFPIPFRVLILFIGGIVGMLTKVSPHVEKYTQIVHLQPRFILTAFLPLLMFKTAFCIDAHTFMRSWGQIFVLAVPGFLINACFTGMIMMVLLGHDEWTYAMGFMFGAICSPIYPVEIVSMLREIGQAKHLSILLEGEGMIGDGTVIILFEILMGVIDENITSWYHVVMVFIRFALGGVLLGFILGKVLGWVMGAIYNDVVNMLISTIAAAYLTYYIGAVIFSVSGVIAVVVLGIMASMEKTSLSVDVEVFLLYFWDMLAYIANTMVFLLAGVIIAERLSEYTNLQDYTLVLVTYVIAGIARFMEYIILAPIVSRIGYGLTFRNMTVAVWGGLRGPVPFCLTLSVFHHGGLSPLGRELLIHIAGLVALTLLINATTMPVLLRLLGLSELSMARKVNMNNCMRHLQNRRDRTISMLKMDRFLADANWPLVNTATVLKHPYKINLNDSDEEEENYLGYHITTCPDCRKEIPNEPTNKEMIEMTREARMRILKAKKISYSRQYENGMLSKEAIRVLTQAVETAMDTEEAVIELDGLHRYFKRQGFIHYTRRKLLAIFFRKSESTVKPPRKYWRRICYHIVTHPAFDIFIYCCIALNVVPIGTEIGMMPKSGSTLSTGLKIANIVFFAVYLLEFILKIYGYSWIYICKHGFRTYFSSYWNIFDFTVLCVAFVDLIMDYLDMFSKNFNKASNKASRVTLATKLVRVVRLMRLLRLCKAWYPKLIKYCDSKIDKHLAFAYDVGKGFVTGEEEVSDMLIQMIDNKTIREDCRLRMEADRLAVTKELGMVQKDRPWIAITVKTRQAVRATLNSMVEAVLELKVSGWVDDVEYAMLMESLEERLKYVRTKIQSVQPSPPKVMFKEVPWMADDEQIADFLYENVITRVFDQGDVVCADGEMADGVYIIVTGLFKLSYIPKKETLHSLAEYGTLPVIDYIASTRFDERVEDYIVSGNCVGELSALTGRPYNCTITADTASQAYILTHEVIKQAIQRSPDPINGLESKMWKSISIRLATSILMDTPAYQSSTQEKIRFQLERAFVPNLSNYKVFGVNDMMEDIILIEGVVFDYNTRDCYTAPCYIPRTVQKIVLPRSSHMNFETSVDTRLLIIPTKDVDEFDIMEREEEISEMVSTASVKCLQHVIQNRSSRLKRKKKRQTTFSMGGGHRRIKYGDSRTSGNQSLGYSRSRITNASSVETELQNISMYEQEGSTVDSYVINEKENRQPAKDQRTSRAITESVEKRMSSSRRSSVPPRRSLNVEKANFGKQNIAEVKEQKVASSNEDEDKEFTLKYSETLQEIKSGEERLPDRSSFSKRGKLQGNLNDTEHRKSDSSKRSVQLQHYQGVPNKNYRQTSIDRKSLNDQGNLQEPNYGNERRKTMTLDDLLQQKRFSSNLRKSVDSGTKERKTSDDRRKSTGSSCTEKQQKLNSDNTKNEREQSDTRKTSNNHTNVIRERKEEDRRKLDHRKTLKGNRHLDVEMESDNQRQSKRTSLNRSLLNNSEELEEYSSALKQRRISDINENADNRYLSELFSSLEESKYHRKSADDSSSGARTNTENINFVREHDRSKEKHEPYDEKHFSKDSSKRKEQTESNDAELTSLSEEQHNRNGTLDQSFLRGQRKSENQDSIIEQRTFNPNVERDTEKVKSSENQTTDERLFPVERSLSYLSQKSKSENEDNVNERKASDSGTDQDIEKIRTSVYQTKDERKLPAQSSLTYLRKKSKSENEGSGKERKTSNLNAGQDTEKVITLEDQTENDRKFSVQSSLTYLRKKSKSENEGNAEKQKAMYPYTGQDTEKLSSLTNETGDRMEFPVQSSLTYLRKKSKSENENNVKERKASNSNTEQDIEKITDQTEYETQFENLTNQNRRQRTSSYRSDERASLEDDKESRETQWQKEETALNTSRKSTRSTGGSVENDEGNKSEASQERRMDTVLEEAKEEESTHK